MIELELKPTFKLAGQAGGDCDCRCGPAARAQSDHNDARAQPGHDSLLASGPGGAQAATGSGGSDSHQ